MNIAIITGGDLDEDFVNDFLKRNAMDKIIAADRGMKFCYDNLVKPDLIMGDYDSIDGKILEYYGTKTDIPMETFPAEKDDTDTEIALKKAMELGGDQIFILGAMGGRMDHFLANVQLLQMPLARGIQAYLVDSQNVIRLIDHPLTLKKCEQFGKYTSLMPFTDQVEHITLKGFKYPLQDYCMVKGSSIGISNEIKEETAEILFNKGTLIMIQSKD